METTAALARREHPADSSETSVLDPSAASALGCPSEMAEFVAKIIAELSGR